MRTLSVAALLLFTSGLLPAYAQSPTPDRDPVSRPAAAPSAAPTPVRMQPPAGLSWSGFYLAGLGGYALAKSEAESTTVWKSGGYFAQSSVTTIASVGKQNLDHNKPTFGGQAGFGVQVGTLVLGAEADYQSMKLDGTESVTKGYPCCPGTDFTLNESVETSYLATARGRVGFSTGRVLIFGTAGIAMTDLNYQAKFTDTYASVTENGGVDERRDALVYGGGLEVRGGARWSVKAEFLRADFGTVSTTSDNLQTNSGPGSPEPFPLSVFTHSSSLVLNTIRGAVVIRF